MKEERERGVKNKLGSGAVKFIFIHPRTPGKIVKIVLVIVDRAKEAAKSFPPD